MKKKLTKKQQAREQERKKKIKSFSNAQEYIRRKIKKQNAEYLQLFNQAQTEAKGNFNKKINPKDKRSRTYKTFLNAELKKITQLNNQLKEVTEKRQRVQQKYKPRAAKKVKTISTPKKGVRRVNNAKDSTSGGGFFAWSFNDFVETIKPLNFFGVDAKTFDGLSTKKELATILSNMNEVFRNMSSDDMLVIKFNLANQNLFYELQIGVRLADLSDEDLEDFF